MEEEGIFYFFTFADGAHTLVLADSNSACMPCPHAEKLVSAQAARKATRTPMPSPASSRTPGW